MALNNDEGPSFVDQISLLSCLVCCCLTHRCGRRSTRQMGCDRRGHPPPWLRRESLRDAVRAGAEPGSEARCRMCEHIRSRRGVGFHVVRDSACPLARTVDQDLRHRFALHGPVWLFRWDGNMLSKPVRDYIRRNQGRLMALLALSLSIPALIRASGALFANASPVELTLLISFPLFAVFVIAMHLWILKNQGVTGRDSTRDE